MPKVEQALPAERSGDMSRVKKPQVWCYYSIPIYWRTAGGDFVLLKEPGEFLRDRLGSEMELPEDLFVLKRDKAEAIPEVQEGLNAELIASIAGDDVARVKGLIADIVEETFSEPRAANMVPLKNTVKTVVTGYAGRREALRRLAMMGTKDYSTVIHSVNVSALVLGYCAHRGMEPEASADLGLSGLLHDVGKLFVDNEILTAQRKLTPEEFEKVREHPSLGHRFLQDAEFPPEVLEACLQHHERIDGGGYPKGTSLPSFAGQLVGVIDCYEALTSDERHYREALDPLPTLELLKKEMQDGKFERQLFKDFAYSLV
jgi:HD-GYP domain-containing protein (c-di-GMP phosphodiesterase class II)